MVDSFRNPPTNAFASTSTEQNGDVLALEQESLRYNWNRWGMALELGLVKEGEEADVHIGGVLRPLIQPLVQAGLTARWNVGQGDADLGPSCAISMVVGGPSTSG